MYSLLLLNGGIGSRLGAEKAKQFLKLNGIPILAYALKVADRVSGITEIVVNFPPGERDVVEQLVSDYAVQTPVVYVEPGETRHDSVLALLKRASNDNVLIHETARPLVSEEDFSSLISSSFKNVSLMRPISFTVAPVDPATSEITGSLERDRLRNVQLPQKFSKEDLLAAHTKAESESMKFTEDSTLLAVAGIPVHFIDGNDRNLKITTPVDMKIARALLSREEDINE